ncbi:cell wall hydrolase SleB [Methylocella silvestris BL2]|uniref:Cell wall hydrolase SleB n=1 Tax=Methylocella silvestris (strain DSM 15510 / CIP 108128 / LMG 27833 / NCIMB 13906 / BL2) TaxID=395965 RepID=B8ENF4_METSB|nr:cell wall hydrolase [Methylocella silvestris]ACK50085.1 cell wall hydrolase SleB [Methylocella silvestris BL2]
MGRSRLGWAAGVIAPWWLGAALVVSIPADAGQEAVTGASLAPLSLRAPTAPSNLIPQEIASLGGAFAATPGVSADESSAPLANAPRFLREASLFAENAGRHERLADEIEPRADRKHNAAPAPTIARAGKGDPTVGLRPTFDARLRREGGLANLRAHDLLFEHEDAWPVGGFEASEADFAGPDSVAAFEPWPDGETPTTAPPLADSSPRPERSALTMRPASVNERLMQGATPPIRRADALSSTTPAAADSTPIEVAAVAPDAPPQGLEDQTSSAPRASVSPGASDSRASAYAALGDRKWSAQEQRCLAEAIYFEARSESDQGQAAVAQVVLNRVSSGLYPPTICGVVYQNRQRRNACQFSFACEGRALRVSEPDAWRSAVRIANEVTTGATYVADVGASTHYHANYVRPRWARRLEKMDVIGHHIFYKLRPGQT